MFILELGDQVSGSEFPKVFLKFLKVFMEVVEM